MPTMKRKQRLLFLLLLPQFLSAQNSTSYFEKQLDSLYEQHRDAVGVLMHIESPDRNISWTYSVGFANKDTEQTLNPEQPVLIASNTKTYVAAAILRLVEKKQLELDQSLASCLKSKTGRLLKRNGYDIDRINVRHLLSHTSGIRDYVNDDYFERVNEKPQFQWKKKQQIKRSLKLGGPLFTAETQFSYGDINYLLLTEIIEVATNETFYDAMHDLLKFEQLNLGSTWFESLQIKPSNVLPLAHQYADTYNWDSYNLNPSWDVYGGGGLAATVKDAAMFYQYLFEGKIIEDSLLLHEMYQYVLPEENSKYCLGIWNMSLPNVTAYFHGGWWGTDVAYIPETNTSVAVFTLQKSKRHEFARLSIDFMNKLKEDSETEQTVITPEYELHRAEEEKGVLILFPGGAATVEETKEEFDILTEAKRNNISVLFMNFNRHLWVDSIEMKTLQNQLETVFSEHQLTTGNVYVGGMSIGGNVALSLSNFLIEKGSEVQPEGVFIVDAPIDLYALYESSQKDIANSNFSEERRAEPKFIVRYFEEAFGSDSLLANMQRVSPFTMKNRIVNVSYLEQCKVRFYIEPDREWYLENRGITLESTNAYTIQEVVQELKNRNWNLIELIETEQRGYRANGERNPHSWSIVDVQDMLRWMLE